MPVIFAELATTFRPREVSDPNSPAAAANGQYLLIRRDAYDAVSVAMPLWRRRSSKMWNWRAW